MLQKPYITLLFLLVASSAFAQKTERDYLRSGNKLYNDSLFIKAEVDYRKALKLTRNQQMPCSIWETRS